MVDIFIVKKFMNKSIGIIANSNDIDGVNKLIAMMANDLSNDDTSD